MTAMTKLVIYAWVGEDEFGSGKVGIKQGVVPAGTIPLASMDLQKLSMPYLVEQMQVIVNQYQTPRRLVRFVEDQTVVTMSPK
jgi:hypothetical protein